MPGDRGVPGLTGKRGRRIQTGTLAEVGARDTVHDDRIDADLAEPRITVMDTGSADGEAWTAYRGTLGPADSADAAVLKRGRSPVEVLAWCRLNGLVTDSTVVIVQGRAIDLPPRDVRQIIAQCDRLAGFGAGVEPALEALQQPPRLRHATLIVNVGVQPLRDRLRADEHLTTSDADALARHLLELAHSKVRDGEMRAPGGTAARLGLSRREQLKALESFLGEQGLLAAPASVVRGNAERLPEQCRTCHTRF